MSTRALPGSARSGFDALRRYSTIRVSPERFV
jgi:hypothetical protein